MDIHKLAPTEISDAIALAWRVFQQFEAPDYGAMGVESFRSTIYNASFTAQLRLYGAYQGDALVGMIATRSEGAHIALFFVEEAFQRQGVGKALFQRILPDAPGPVITVNASPFAVPVYQKLGFTALSGEQVRDGIRYTPMRYEAPTQAPVPNDNTDRN